MSNLLFTEVSVEQQEIVAGGVRGRINASASYNQDQGLLIKDFHLSFTKYGPTLSFDKLSAWKNDNGNSSLYGFLGS